MKTPTLAKALPYILIIGGLIGLICSIVLTNDELRLAENPAFQPSCNLNPVIACGSVMKSSQAHLFSIPNPWLGLGAFSVLMTVGVAMLAGAQFKKWFWAGIEVGMTLGMIFAYWLLFESVYHINALCPYCLIVDVAVTTMFWYTAIFVFQDGKLPVPKKLIGAVNFARRHHLDILILWFVIIIAIVLKHFWYYYGQYL